MRNGSIPPRVRDAAAALAIARTGAPAARSASRALPIVGRRTSDAKLQPNRPQSARTSAATSTARGGRRWSTCGAERASRCRTSLPRPRAVAKRDSACCTPRRAASRAARGTSVSADGAAPAAASSCARSRERRPRRRVATSRILAPTSFTWSVISAAARSAPVVGPSAARRRSSASRESSSVFVRGSPRRAAAAASARNDAGSGALVARSSSSSSDVASMRSESRLCR